MMQPFRPQTRRNGSSRWCLSACMLLSALLLATATGCARFSTPTLGLKLGPMRLFKTPPLVRFSVNRARPFQRFWKEEDSMETANQEEKQYAMNVVLTGKMIAVAADEVTKEGDRLPLTNFQSWPYIEDEEDDARMLKFEHLLEARPCLTEPERESIKDQVKQVLSTIRYNSPRKASKALMEMENIRLRDGREVRRQMMEAQLAKDTEAVERA